MRLVVFPLAAVAVFHLPGLELAAAQVPADIAGHVALETRSGSRRLGGVMVTLHGLGPQSAGPLDSVLTDARGVWRFRIVPDTTITYIATARRGGIAYFATPWLVGDRNGGGEIVVFDTASAGIPIRVAGRHLIISGPTSGGVRTVVDVYELENQDVMTRVTGELPVFTVTLPAVAADVRSTQGDFTGTAISTQGGGAAIIAPFPPGMRQLVLTYEVPATAFPLSLPVTDSAAVLEVLAEESEATVAGPGIEPLGAVTVEGRNFVRFLASDVPAGQFLVVTLPVAGRALITQGGLVVLVLALGTVVALAAGARRGKGHVRGRREAVDEAITGVDQLLQTTDEVSRSGLEAYRAGLVAERKRLGS
ncbi:MAG: hypothetical protein ACT4OZ_09520 [Gemmatimonadota bacterium]